MPAFFALSTTN